MKFEAVERYLDLLLMGFLLLEQQRLRDLERAGPPAERGGVNCFNRSGTNRRQLEATFSPSVNGNVRCCNSKFFSFRRCRAWASLVRRVA